MQKGFLEWEDQLQCMHLTWTQNQIRLNLQKQNVKIAEGCQYWLDSWYYTESGVHP